MDLDEPLGTPSAHAVSTPVDLRLSQRACWAGGQPISHMMAQALAQPELISLAAGFVDQATLPAEPIQAAIEAILADGQAAREALQYGTTAGYLPLREALLARLAAHDGAAWSGPGPTPERVVVTAGSNQLLHLVAETLLDPGDIVLCAGASYFVFLGTLANLGARSIGVPADQDGLIPEALEAELARLDADGQLPRVKAIYCASYFDNPSSVTLSEERRPLMVEAARRWSRAGRIHIIEDTAYRELRYEGHDVPSLLAFDESQETVISTGSFSKSFSPGLRVGWGILPRELVAPVCDQKGNVDFGSPNFTQHLMARVLEMGLFDSHVELLCNNYRSKRDAMLAAANESLAGLPGVDWIHPQGGLYLWVTLPQGVDAGSTSRLFRSALEAGVLYVPGEHCYPAEGPCQKNTLRLSFGVQSPENIRRGVHALAEAIAEALP